MLKILFFCLIHQYQYHHCDHRYLNASLASILLGFVFFFISLFLYSQYHFYWYISSSHFWLWHALYTYVKLHFYHVQFLIVRNSQEEKTFFSYSQYLLVWLFLFSSSFQFSCWFLLRFFFFFFFCVVFGLFMDCVLSSWQHSVSFLDQRNGRITFHHRLHLSRFHWIDRW